MGCSLLPGEKGISLMRQQRRNGYITGPLVIQDDGGRHDLRDRIWTGPTDESRKQILVAEHDARFTLLVEKRNIFNRLIEDGFHRTNRCILASGDGYPGRSFHAILRQLHDQLRIPFYVLADNDPAGYLLFFLIARGTVQRNGKWRATMAIRDARYLGLRADDYQQLGLSEDCQIHLSESDLEQIAHLKSCPWLRSNVTWQKEFDQVLRNGFKIEVEAPYALAKSLFIDAYLPQQILADDLLRL
jgi:DNA topoisomerase VI subunit A